MGQGEWQKVLWKHQPFPDNHVPRSFLSSLARNRESCVILKSLSVSQFSANFKPYTYWKLVLLSCPIAQQATTIFIFLATFVRVKQRLLDPRILVWFSVVAFVLGYLLWEVIDSYLSKAMNRQRQPTNRMFPIACTPTLYSTLTDQTPRRSSRPS